MKEIVCDVVVVGAGPAGLAAAIAAKNNGARHVVIVERDENLGGILQQCIHPGFGLRYFNEELTGPEYAQKFIDLVAERKIEVLLETTALSMEDDVLICANKKGIYKINSKAAVLAMGCRERTRGNLMIPGSRPSGIFTAGTAQRLLNIQGYMVGKEIVILGSGDIGMIMARRMALEGAHVKAVVEIMPYLAGLTRNRVQCLDDFNIPLFLSHTVVDITGEARVQSVMITPVDPNKNPILEEGWEIECDTLLLSVGLIPENELSRTGKVFLSPITKGATVNQYMQTSVPSVFACGNVLHVNDLVDNVTRESEVAGYNAALYAQRKLSTGGEVHVLAGKNVSYVCPQRVAVAGSDDLKLFFRVNQPLRDVVLTAECCGLELYRRKVIAVNPGEMEYVCVRQAQLARLTESITVNAIQTEAE